MGVYYYDFRLLIGSAVAVASAVLAELLVALCLRHRPPVGDLTAIVTGLVISLLLPVGISYRYLVFASLIAVLIAKMMFGGVGKNIFNPALVGVTAVTLISNAAATTYYAQGANLPFFGSIAPETATTQGLLSVLKQGEGTFPSLLDAFVGKAGDIPASVCVPVLLVVGMYLAYRRIVSLSITVSLLATVAALALLFPRAEALGPSVALELMAGSLLFCSVFCANDPVTTPNTSAGKVLFGILVGVITMLIRWYGRFDEGILFALLITNAMSFALDKAVRKLRIIRKGGEKLA